MTARRETIDLVEQLKESCKNQTGTATLLRHFGLTSAHDSLQPFCEMSVEKSIALILNWIAYKMPKNQLTTVRIPHPIERKIYEITFKRNKHRLLVTSVKSVFPVGDGILHHWDKWTNYENLTVFKINASIECADALNSFNSDLWDKKIDDLVNEAIQLDLPEFGETIYNVTIGATAETDLPKSAEEIYNERKESDKLDTPPYVTNFEEPQLPELDKKLIELCEWVAANIPPPE